MADVLTRGFVPELEVRAASKGGDGRTIEGIAVPYGVAQRIDSTLTEQFARGAFAHQVNAAHRVRLGREHPLMGGTVIGKAVELREDAAGLWGAFRVSETEAGDETLTLVRDGVLDELSVGFRARQDRRLKDGTIERVKADLIEVSVVFMGAYGREAVVTGVRRAAGFDCSCECTCGTAPVARSGLAEAAQILGGLPVLPAA